nr:MAG TPA: hypothetical protein [Caudoviricetes sp.]DAR57186.1 MAG TPA: hypothetical protein [Caudoviricetes sp.]DAW80571.1 MAG TPA: hypothetical protein [Caudoviricetes sp.]
MVRKINQRTFLGSLFILKKGARFEENYRKKA